MHALGRRIRRQPGSGSRVASAGAFTFALVITLGPHESCLAGFTREKDGAKTHEGKKIEAGTPEYGRVQDAINELCVQSVNQVQANREILESICKQLGQNLASGGINSEQNAEANKNGAHMQGDGKRGFSADDKMNINPDVLKAGGETLEDYLKSILVHEAIHGMQTEAELRNSATVEKAPLEWQKWLLARVKHLPADDPYLKIIQDHLNKANNPSPGGSRGGAQSNKSNFYFTVNTLDRDVHAVDSLTYLEVFQFDSGFPVPVDLVKIEAPGGQALLVCGTDSSETSGGIALFRDLDSNGWVDPTSRVYLVPPGGLVCPVSMSLDPTTGDLFILDTVAGNIWRMMDLDADTIPETLGPSPWAAVGSFPDISGARDLQLLQSGAVVLYPQRSLDYHFTPGTVIRVLRDVDVDGIADLMEEQPACELVRDFTPVARGTPMGGDTSVRVMGQLGATVEAWTTTPSGPRVYLGSGTVVACSLLVDIALSQPLAAGDSLVLVMPASMEPSSRTAIAAPMAEILEAYPARISAGSPLRLRGRYFGSIAGAVFVGGLPAPVSSWSDTEVAVVVPAPNPDLFTDLAMARLQPAVGAAFAGPLEPALFPVVYAAATSVVPGTDEVAIRPRLSLVIFPNPAPDGAIRASFHVPVAGHVELAVFDVAGRRLRTLVSSQRGIGVHQASWDGRDAKGVRVAPGTYFLRLSGAGAGAGVVNRVVVIR